MKYPAYPKYKKSGVEWLDGDGSTGSPRGVPEHWDVKRLKYLFSVWGRIGFRGYTTEDLVDEGQGALTLGATHINDKGYIDISEPIFITWQKYYESPEIMVRENDLIVVQRGSCGKVALVDFDLGPTTINPSLILLKNAKALPKFVLYVLLSSYIQSRIATIISSTAVPMLSQEQVANFAIIFPTLSEQQTIADFLDHETGRIDDLIAKKERLIELLKEKRMALISRAVTKGLNPKDKMKPSGVEWLGDMPEHWDVSALKHFCDVRDGTHDTPEFVSPDENTYPLITSKDLIAGHLVVDNEKHISESDYRFISQRSGVDKGDILMPMIGTVGGAVLVQTNERFAIKNVALFKKSAKYEPQWLQYMLNSHLSTTQFDLQKSGGVQSFVGLGTIRNLIFPLPSPHEQKTIAEFLDRETNKIDALISKVETAIAKLKEYRTALISAAVTGKIDVSTGLNTGGQEVA